jgi:hypothetical protein
MNLQIVCGRGTQSALAPPSFIRFTVVDGSKQRFYGFYPFESPRGIYTVFCPIFYETCWYFFISSILVPYPYLPQSLLNPLRSLLKLLPLVGLYCPLLGYRLISSLPYIQCSGEPPPLGTPAQLRPSCLGQSPHTTRPSSLRPPRSLRLLRHLLQF